MLDLKKARPCRTEEVDDFDKAVTRREIINKLHDRESVMVKNLKNTPKDKHSISVYQTSLWKMCEGLVSYSGQPGKSFCRRGKNPKKPTVN